MLLANLFYNFSLTMLAGYSITILFIIILILYEMLGHNPKTNQSRILLVPYILTLGTIFLFIVLKSFI